MQFAWRAGCLQVIALFHLSFLRLTGIRVEDIDFRHGGSLITLFTQRSSWSQAFRSLKMRLDHATEGHTFRPHSTLNRRQSARASSSATALPSLTVTVPTTTSTATVNSLNVDTQPMIDKDLLPSNSSLQITCTDCSTHGSLDFSFAEFEFAPDLDRTVQGGFILDDIFNGGEVSVVAIGLGAHIELYLNISNSGHFSIPLFEIPLLFAVKVSRIMWQHCYQHLTHLQILGIGAAGLMYAPELRFNYDLKNSSLYVDPALDAY